MTDEEDRIVLERMGLLGRADAATLVPLSGGVSSDIRLVHTSAGERPLVFKRALTTLRVDAEWHAPIRRGQAEANWLRFAGSVTPECVPQVLATDDDTFAIALEYLPPERFANWKTHLLSGKVDVAFAGAVGRLIGRIHSASASSPGLSRRFANQDLFESLRIEPYLRRTVEAVPEVATELRDVIGLLEAPGRVLIHGDLSPKNILVGPDSPVVLDAECATWSDPAFDVAFCLTHLVLKSVHLTGHADKFREAADVLRREYLSTVNWEPAEEVDRRIGRILPGLLLARVVGASPVEYLDTQEQFTIRTLAVDALRCEQSMVFAQQRRNEEDV
ncbi:phosphotransferase family protein [Paramicrobacterium chengjingii]|uniref:phosphotransferase family protein n=1 Tax=Paramicrobacterium chengjingii TaxID=2769067 RepID=UPI00141E841D|nr:aminoglycoside phosphotransferase family protein [Microbacterium chengjingii]